MMNLAILPTSLVATFALLATVFEVVTGGKVYRVTGAVLQRWIVESGAPVVGPRDAVSPAVVAGVPLRRSSCLSVEVWPTPASHALAQRGHNIWVRVR